VKKARINYAASFEDAKANDCRKPHSFPYRRSTDSDALLPRFGAFWARLNRPFYDIISTVEIDPKYKEIQ